MGFLWERQGNVWDISNKKSQQRTGFLGGER
jgi:hypothetical protein